MKKNNFIYQIIIFSAIFFAMATLPSLASAMNIVISIPGNYTEVKAGNSVYFATEVKWPENDGRKDLRIEYSIRNKDGKEVAYLKVLKAIETQASFMDFISLPESLPTGTYRIYASISDYENLNQEVVASFNIIGRDTTQTYLLIIIGVLGIIILVGLIDLYAVMKKIK